LRTRWIAIGFDFLIRRGDSEQLSRVHATGHNVADDEIALGDLGPDLVACPWSRDTKYLCPLLHSLTVEADAGIQEVVRDEVLRDVFVKDGPVALVSLSSIAWM
jgi:hypothetical protein